MSEKIPVLLSHEAIVLIMKLLNEAPMPMRVARPIYDDLQQQVTTVLLQRRKDQTLALAEAVEPVERDIEKAMAEMAEMNGEARN